MELSSLNDPTRITTKQHERLVALCHTLVSQTKARIIVPPQANASGFWFGGGNMSVGPDGHLYLVGRYRNAGDSRTGLAAGARGLELAVFCSRDHGASFEKVASFSKDSLSQEGRDVLSIEGSAMRWTTEGVELFVSTEKDGIGYPNGFEDYLKPGTGVWTIDRLQAASLKELDSTNIVTVLDCRDPQFIHVKDPFLYSPTNGQAEGSQSVESVLFFCSHPFGWTSSNTGFATRRTSQQYDPTFHYFSRGLTWDVGMSRGTAFFDVPSIGAFANHRVSLLFYDGGECVRNHDEHAQAVKRPRGYSCEELGGAAFFLDSNWQELERLSTTHPFFISPFGTGCSRYVDVLLTDDGAYVTWQQAQEDGSQPLVLNFVPRETIESTLS